MKGSITINRKNLNHDGESCPVLVLSLDQVRFVLDNDEYARGNGLIAVKPGAENFVITLDKYVEDFEKEGYRLNSEQVVPLSGGSLGAKLKELIRDEGVPCNLQVLAKQLNFARRLSGDYDGIELKVAPMEEIRK
ncbi:MAG: hypothetical protein ABIB47_05455 [Candidatus Woesearchaeota archaeon]